VGLGGGGLRSPGGEWGGRDQIAGGTGAEGRTGVTAAVESAGRER